MPVLCFFVLEIEVDNVEGDASRNADERLRPPRPVLGDDCFIGTGILKTMLGEWLFIPPTGEDADAALSQP